LRTLNEFLPHLLHLMCVGDLFILPKDKVHVLIITFEYPPDFLISLKLDQHEATDGLRE